MLKQSQAWGLTSLSGKRRRKGYRWPPTASAVLVTSEPGKPSLANSQQLKSGSRLHLFMATLVILKMGSYFQQNLLFPRTVFLFANLFVGQDQHSNPMLLTCMVGLMPWLSYTYTTTVLCCLHPKAKRLCLSFLCFPGYFDQSHRLHTLKVLF